MRPLAMASLLLIAACSAKPDADGAFKVVVTFSGFHAGCITVTATDSAKPSNTASVSEAEDGGFSVKTGTRIFAVYRKSSWGTLTDLTASAQELSCAGATVATQTQAKQTFAVGQIPEVDFTLIAQDQDSDGYVSTANGGTDCNDSDPSIHPGAPEICTGNVDADCDGKAGCADPDCAGQSCGAAPNACQGAPTCQGGTCTPGAGVVCNNPNNQCASDAGVCVPDSGCQYPPLDAGVSCNAGLCVLSAACDGNGGCGGQSVVCDGGVPGSCVTVACNPVNGACSPTVYDAGEPCDGGVCIQDATCHPAFVFSPSNFNPYAVPVSAISPVLNLTCGGFTFDTDQLSPNSWCGTQINPYYLGDAGTDPVLIAALGLTQSTNNQISFVGSHPVILAVYGDATVGGQLLVGSSNGTQGAGGGADPSCDAGGAGQLGQVSGGLLTAGGGGGGGFGRIGGAGGEGDADGGAGGAGGRASTSRSLVPLRGGCNGAPGATESNSTPGDLGIGGGAIQVSVSGVLNLTGTVAAPGAGGLGAAQANNNHAGSGGGGGGSGGGILLEASSAQLGTGTRLTANGGAGGGGASDNADGKNGMDGHPDNASPAKGGAGATSGGNGAGGAGGDGGTSLANATPGAPGSGGTVGGGGGGGGGVGVIDVRAPVCTAVSSARFSPQPAFTPDSGCP